VLNRCVHGEIGIGDDFEAHACVVFEIGGTGDGEPSGFHLRQAAEFGNAAERESERGSLCGEGWRGNSLERKIEKDFVGDDREIVFGADGGELRLFVRLCVVASGIVGMHGDGGAGTRSDGTFE